MRRWMPFAACLLLLGTGYAQEMPQATTQPPASPSVYGVDAFPIYPSPLAPGPGKAKVQAYCSFCHSTTYITTQPPLPAKTWAAEVHKMIKVHGADIPPADAEVIIQYLSQHYGQP